MVAVEHQCFNAILTTGSTQDICKSNPSWKLITSNRCGGNDALFRKGWMTNLLFAALRDNTVLLFNYRFSL